jgi:hypothetical protein
MVTGIIILLCLCYLDVVTTNYILEKGGRELNPLMAYFMSNLGDYWWVPKAVMTLGVAWVTLIIGKPSVLIVVIVIQGLVVMWNLWQLR